jgi:protoheme IX farnesyltransferase
MLPVVRDDAHVANSIVLYTWLMVATSLVLVPVAPMGWVYGIGAALLGAGFLWEAYLLKRRIAAGSGTVTATAMRLFHGSITYLALLFLLVALDPFVP